MTGRTIVGSAPGKLILTGEYAVLDGAPALVAAVDRRATAHISAPERAGFFAVHAPDLDLHATGVVGAVGSGVQSSAAPGRQDSTGMRWEADARTVAGLSLVTHVLENLARRGPLPPCTITLSTAAFFDSSGTKWGLGSSAALTVALAGALAAHAVQAAPTLSELIDLHRAFQGGRGSGADIAASHTGGVICYTTGSGSAYTPGSAPAYIPGSGNAYTPGSTPAYTPGSGNAAPRTAFPDETRRIAVDSGPFGGYTTGSEGGAPGGTPPARTGSEGGTPRSTPPTSTPVTLPENLAWATVFTGHSTSTTTMLEHLDTWRTEHPRQYEAAATRLAEAAEQAAKLCQNAPRAHPVINPAAFLEAIDAYAEALDALGAAAGLDIMSADHRRLRNLAADRGVIYKPSGAGGGDVGIAFAGDPDHIARFRDSASAAGYRMIDMDVDRHGLTVTGG